MENDAAALSSEATVDVTPEPQKKALVHPYRHNPLEGMGVVQLRYEYRCKICQLSSKAPTLYRRIHELVYNDHMTYGQAMNEVNTYIKQHGMQLTMLNAVNVTGHFKKHIEVEEAVAVAIRNEPAYVPPAVAAIAPLAQKAAQDGLDDFRNLEILRHGITTQLEKLQGQLDIVDPKTNQLKLDKWSLDLYVKVVRETRAVIGDLNEMRRSEKLMNNVVQTLLDRLTFAIIPQLLEEYKLIAEELESCKIPTDIVVRIDERLRRKTAEIIVQTTRAAVTEVQRQFKLR
jgi:hypothetical protein